MFQITTGFKVFTKSFPCSIKMNIQSTLQIDHLYHNFCVCLNIHHLKPNIHARIFQGNTSLTHKIFHFEEQLDNVLSGLS